jgi:imidazoleglycerol-phosphate dehydratase
VDFHHSVEDIGICLGKAFLHALGDKKGICRYGSMLLPMDEALVLAALDISGRSYLAYDVEFPSQKVGEFDTELVREFFEAFVRNAGITLHLKKMAGANSHHIAEACFKSFAGVLKSAVSLDLNTDDIPSSKGIL